MKRILAAALFAVLGFATIAPASAQQYTPNGQLLPPGYCSSTSGLLNPCTSTIGDTGFSATLTTTLTQFIAAPASGSIRIANIQYAAYESATGGAMEIEYGTGTNCGTGTTLLAVLAYVPATTAVQGYYGKSDSVTFIVPAGKAACAFMTAGTITVAQIAGTYATY